ncbi:MAG: hypothetical protein R3A10_18935 [Caldilineaceae bacterium]
MLTRRDEWTGRTLAAALGLALTGALASAGFWFGRNVALYGELIPLGAAGEVLPTLRRAEVMSLPTWHAAGSSTRTGASSCR